MSYRGLIGGTDFGVVVEELYLTWYDICTHSFISLVTRKKVKRC